MRCVECGSRDCQNPTRPPSGWPQDLLVVGVFLIVTAVLLGGLFFLPQEWFS